jgi:hypothetical protein
LVYSEYTEYEISFAYGFNKPYDAYLNFDFAANLAEIYADGEKLNDMLYTGMPFEVSLRYHLFPAKIVLRLYPLFENADVYLEKKPVFQNGKAAELLDFSVETVSRELLEIVN